MITAINMMGSGIIMLPTKLAQVGTMSILSWLVTGIGSMALAYAFAQCGMFSRKMAVWVDMQNILTENLEALWQTIPMVCHW